MGSSKATCYGQINQNALSHVPGKHLIFITCFKILLAFFWSNICKIGEYISQNTPFLLNGRDQKYVPSYPVTLTSFHAYTLYLLLNIGTTQDEN